MSGNALVITAKYQIEIVIIVDPPVTVEIVEILRQVSIRILKIQESPNLATRSENDVVVARVIHDIRGTNVVEVA